MTLKPPPKVNVSVVEFGFEFITLYGFAVNIANTCGTVVDEVDVVDDVVVDTEVVVETDVVVVIVVVVVGESFAMAVVYE